MLFDFISFSMMSLKDWKLLEYIQVMQIKGLHEQSNGKIATGSLITFSVWWYLYSASLQFSDVGRRIFSVIIHKRLLRHAC